MNNDLATLTRLIDDVFQSLHAQIDDTKAKVTMMLNFANTSNTTSKISQLNSVMATHPAPATPNVAVKVLPLPEDLFLSPTYRPTLKTPITEVQTQATELSIRKKPKTPEVVPEVVPEEEATGEEEEMTGEEESPEEATGEEEAPEEATGEEEAPEEATGEEETPEEEATGEEETPEEATGEEETPEEETPEEETPEEETPEEETPEEETPEEEATGEEETPEEPTVEFEPDTINGHDYFRAMIDGEYKIYAMIDEETPGDEVGRYVKNKAVFDKVRELTFKLRKYFVGLDDPYTIYEYTTNKQPGAIRGTCKDNKVPVFNK